MVVTANRWELKCEKRNRNVLFATYIHQRIRIVSLIRLILAALKVGMLVCFVISMFARKCKGSWKCIDLSKIRKISMRTDCNILTLLVILIANWFCSIIVIHLANFYGHHPMPTPGCVPRATSKA